MDVSVAPRRDAARELWTVPLVYWPSENISLLLNNISIKASRIAQADGICAPRCRRLPALIRSLDQRFRQQAMVALSDLPTEHGDWERAVEFCAEVWVSNSQTKGEMSARWGQKGAIYWFHNATSLMAECDGSVLPKKVRVAGSLLQKCPVFFVETKL